MNQYRTKKRAIDCSSYVQSTPPNWKSNLIWFIINDYPKGDYYMKLVLIQQTSGENRLRNFEEVVERTQVVFETEKSDFAINLWYEIQAFKGSSIWSEVLELVHGLFTPRN